MTMKHGDEGDDVEALQKMLNHAGAKLIVNRIFDRETQAAVRVFQKNHHLEETGEVDSLTLSALTPPASF